MHYAVSISAVYETQYIIHNFISFRSDIPMRNHSPKPIVEIITLDEDDEVDVRPEKSSPAKISDLPQIDSTQPRLEAYNIALPEQNPKSEDKRK